MTKYIQVTTSTDSEKLAKEILQALLKKRLVACGHVCSPMNSSYWWQGKIQNSKEWAIIMKTRMDLFPKIEKVIRSMHSYDTPEILALPILKVSNDYRKWMDRELKD